MVSPPEKSFKKTLLECDFYTNLAEQKMRFISHNIASWIHYKFGCDPSQNIPHLAFWFGNLKSIKGEGASLDYGGSY
jgi:hypothetical protein